MGVIGTVVITLMLLTIVLGIFRLLNKFILNKISVNKWIILFVSLAIFVLQFLYKSKYMLVNYILTGVTAIFFLWFLQINQFGNPKKQKQVVIKPKAKPNRVKNIDKK